MAAATTINMAGIIMVGTIMAADTEAAVTTENSPRLADHGKRLKTKGAAPTIPRLSDPYPGGQFKMGGNLKK
jgi:hypothetical protein